MLNGLTSAYLCTRMKLYNWYLKKKLINLKFFSESYGIFDKTIFSAT